MHSVDWTSEVNARWSATIVLPARAGSPSECIRLSLRSAIQGMRCSSLFSTWSRMNWDVTSRKRRWLELQESAATSNKRPRKATIVHEKGYHAGLVSLGALNQASEAELIAHCRAVAEIIPLVGFYLQPAAGGRVLPYSFWRRFAEIENVAAIKIAPFDRYRTLEVIRAVAESERDDIALYTGNDDNIVIDLLTPFRFDVAGTMVERRIVGGLLGHWAVWTRKAVELHAECRRVAQSGLPVPLELLRRNIEITDANAAFFDAANGFAGCIPGIHEVLRRQGLLEGIWCLDPRETLSVGQREEIDRVSRAYPHLNDDEFVASHRDQWLSKTNNLTAVVSGYQYE